MYSIHAFAPSSHFTFEQEDDIKVDNIGTVDLSGRSLSTIPVALHRGAEQIRSLSLSRNPMLEIPLDFIQSCTSLKDLKLSNMALKRVPHSIKSSLSLQKLDISCNRIADLGDAYLEGIPNLQVLQAQNNRMEKLPWNFPRLSGLVALNISNNKFRSLPIVACELVNLTALDISFNMINELPEEIGKLKNLRNLVMVGNQVSRFPPEARELSSLEYLDCRRNTILDLAEICTLPNLETVCADYNNLHSLDVALGPKLSKLEASHNEITRLSLTPGPIGKSPYALTTLDISHAKLSSLDDLALSQMFTLRTLKLDHNKFPTIPESLGELQLLETLSCADNNLTTLPNSIGRLQRLEHLDVHNNNLTELPVSLWNCASLTVVNVTSNLLSTWHNAPPTAPVMPPADILSAIVVQQQTSERKASTTSFTTRLPPLAYSLEKLYMGENNFTDEVLHPLTVLRELRVLNLSFNDLQELPVAFFKNFSKLEELYLSGNKLASLPSEDLPRLTKLRVLYLNGNKLQTLPHELGKVMSLTVLDVGSNSLKYNINNWEYDWNWYVSIRLHFSHIHSTISTGISIKACDISICLVISVFRSSPITKRTTVRDIVVTSIRQSIVLGVFNLLQGSQVSLSSEFLALWTLQSHSVPMLVIFQTKRRIAEFERLVQLSEECLMVLRTHWASMIS